MKVLALNIFNQPDVFDEMVVTIQGWLDSGPQLPTMSALEFFAIPAHERGKTRWLKEGDCFLTYEAVYYSGFTPVAYQYQCNVSAKQLKWSMDLDYNEWKYDLETSRIPDGAGYAVSKSKFDDSGLDYYFASQSDLGYFKEMMLMYVTLRLESFERSIEPQRAELTALVERYSNK